MSLQWSKSLSVANINLIKLGLQRRYVNVSTMEFFLGKVESSMTDSVTRLGDFLHFGHIFKAIGNN